jgi:hypothetical protein
MVGKMMNTNRIFVVKKPRTNGFKQAIERTSDNKQVPTSKTPLTKGYTILTNKRVDHKSIPNKSPKPENAKNGRFKAPKEHWTKNRSESRKTNITVASGTADLVRNKSPLVEIGQQVPKNCLKTHFWHKKRDGQQLRDRISENRAHGWIRNVEIVEIDYSLAKNGVRTAPKSPKQILEYSIEYSADWALMSASSSPKNSDDNSESENPDLTQQAEF